MIHGLKIMPHLFADVIVGEKTFEIRKNDRPFHKGDLLALNEFDGKDYTGRSCLVYVDYIMDNPDYVKKDMVVMAIKPCGVHRFGGPRNQFSMREDYSVPLATEENAEKFIEQIMGKGIE